jgi:hypothetical protein
VETAGKNDLRAENFRFNQDEKTVTYNTHL